MEDKFKDSEVLIKSFKKYIETNNTKQVDERNMEAGKRIPLTDIGAGVYPTTIFFNHSCAPNTVRINMGKRVKTC